MVRLNIPLDPARTGREASTLETGLRRMIIGQEAAIEQIVDIYQMHLRGMSATGRPFGNFLFLSAIGIAKCLETNSLTRSRIYRLLRKHFEAGSTRLLRTRGRLSLPRVQICRFFDTFWFTLHSTLPPACSAISALA
jgi:hypothetical protein